ncbi:hypothetical protein [Bradyrhizobium elkanii]|uniref:hypothetical protein n=1 Tax=Bradyrhizobium elkanii TaxID=29448 RepID=UPI0020A1B2A2|nr:hypothetical protein [Bradyrhizobium elkanii]MCP1969780.1 hypothetical protein [Bradyrhizobium elkanii]MCS4108712.1 hypothetical protein [Bradyrhizobium elkanii]
MAVGVVRGATPSEAIDGAAWAAQQAAAGKSGGPVYFSSNDVADWDTIPAIVRDRFLTFREARQDRHAPLMVVSDDVRKAREDLGRAEARLDEVRNDHKVRLGVDAIKDDHPSVIDANERIERATARLTRLTAKHEELRTAWQHAASLVGNNLETYLRKHHSEIRLYEGEEPQLRNGETGLDGLERAARRTRTLKADRQAVLASPYPVAVAKKLAREQLEKRIEAARPDVSQLVDRMESIDFRQQRVGVSQHGGSAAAVYLTDPIGLLAWLFPKEFIAAIDRELAAAGDDENALTMEQRIAKLKEIDGDMLASEREEAKFSELAGLLPRADLDARAVLGLASDMPAPKRD